MTYTPFPQPLLFGYLRMDPDHVSQRDLSTARSRFRYLFHIGFHIFDSGIVIGFQGDQQRSPLFHSLYY
jgi:hypothetical protein